MRKLSWILCATALVATVFLTYNWFWARLHVRAANQEAVKWMREASSWQLTDDLRSEIDDSRVELDLKKIENDNLDVQIAELQGRSSANARGALYRDQTLLSKDELVRDLGRDVDRMGGDPKIGDARERQNACTAAAQVYIGSLHRDEHLAYAVGVLWLAFAFAFALASEKDKAV